MFIDDLDSTQDRNKRLFVHHNDRLGQGIVDGVMRLNYLSYYFVQACATVAYSCKLTFSKFLLPVGIL